MPDSSYPTGTAAGDGQVSPDDQPNLAGLCRHRRCGTPIILYPPDGQRRTPFWDHAEIPERSAAHPVAPRPGSVAPAHVWDCDAARAGHLGTVDARTFTAKGG